MVRKDKPSAPHLRSSMSFLDFIRKLNRINGLHQLYLPCKLQCLDTAVLISLLLVQNGERSCRRVECDCANLGEVPSECCNCNRKGNYCPIHVVNDPSTQECIMKEEKGKRNKCVVLI